jgi:hypothetical protein
MLYTTTYIEIDYSEDTGILTCVWLGYQTDESIINTGAVILNVIKEKKVTKIFNDNREVKGLWLHDWTREVWFPSIIEAGILKFAWIYSNNIFARMSGKKAAGQTKVVKAFSSAEEAYAWLQQD